MNLRRALSITAALLALSMLPSTGVAQPAAAPEAAWRAAFDRGREALQARRFAEAELALREAMGLRPTPVTGYNLALALRGLGRYLEAVDAFERYLRAPEPEASPERLAAIRDELRVLEGAIGRVDVTLQPVGAALRVDGREVPLTPGGLRLDPGVHVFDVEAEGFERDRRELSMAPGARVVLAIALRPLASEGRLIVEPNVPGARVALDAEPAGEGRVERTVAPGDHVIEVRAAGHDVWRRSVRVTARATLRVDASLTRTAAVVAPSRGWLLPAVLGGGALVVAGVVTAIAFATRGDEAPVRGNWGNFTAP